jgi:hypothetical protein
MQNDQIANMLAQFFNMQQQQQQAQANNEEKKDDDNPAASLGMAEEELNTTLAMCGLPPGANIALLPTWIQQCAAKGTSDAYKKIIIRKHIMSHSRYEDAEVPLTNSILKMVAKKNWLGDEANVTCPSLGNAGAGLSPFIVLDIDEDKVTALNMEDDALLSASLVKPSELLAAKKRAKAQVPKTADGFLLMLRKYTNLLFALFGADCPLFLCLVQIISAFKGFSRGAREKMSHSSRASILWVLLK